MTLGGPKDRFEPLQNFAQKGCENRSPMIDQGLGHGPSNALWHDARAWYLKKGPAGHKMRERYLIFPGYVKGVGLASTLEAQKQYRYPLKRDIAAFKLERIRSRERARSPISSCDSIPTLTGVSRSPLLILSATCLKRRMGRVITAKRIEERMIPPRRIAAIIPIIGRRLRRISPSTKSARIPRCAAPTCPPRIGALVSYTVFPPSCTARVWEWSRPSVETFFLSSAGNVPRVWVIISPLPSSMNAYSTPGRRAYFRARPESSKTFFFTTCAAAASLRLVAIARAR